MRLPGFIGPSYTLQSVNVDCQRTVNLYPEINALGTGKEREVASLVPTPGLRLLCALLASPVRGEWRAANGTLFVVGGDKLYSVSSAWVATELGTLNTSVGPVSMADDGTYLAIVDGSYGYFLTIASSTLTEIEDENFYPADHVVWQDGYFLFNRAGTGQIFHTDLNSTAFNGLDIAETEGRRDVTKGLSSFGQNIYVFSDQSIEVFYNSGSADSTFTRIQGAVIETGCYATFSIAKGGGFLFFLGGDDTGAGIVYQLQGYQAQRISTPAIESVIRKLSADEIAGARGYVYQQGGHVFYCLNLPGHDATWTYDASTGFWHERCYLDLWNLKRHRADCHALAYGTNVVGDYENGNLYALDPDYLTDNGTPIARDRVAPHVSKNGKNLFHSLFQLDMETGVGLDGTGQGTDPKAMLRWSNDSGNTWSNWRESSVGKIGEKKKRVIWRRLGRARDRVYQVRITDPVKVVLIGAEIEFEEGTS